MMDIDINCDVGEGVGNEAELLPFISSCNIACGGHAGDERSMRSVIRLAKKYGVSIGAHPSYPDRANFGRKTMALSPEALVETIGFQVNGLVRLLAQENVPLSHIKPHGALYNDLAKSEALSVVFLSAITSFKGNCNVVVPYGSIFEKVALEHGFSVRTEAFADRNYNDDLSLVSRAMESAVISRPEAVLEHLLTMVKKNQVVTIAGSHVALTADTYCIHGDTENALQIITYLSRQLPKHDTQIRK
ncbi:5-oxoprolinase subunit PxpA [Maribacter sp. 2-571]|uniref:5-oxoprolinase subunit PxpA n=1 Tax=Maribacter sp. 2-571 TaxID=3417569 RepID=UPI003D3554AB